MPLPDLPTTAVISWRGMSISIPLILLVLTPLNLMGSATNFRCVVDIFDALLMFCTRGNCLFVLNSAWDPEKTTLPPFLPLSGPSSIR